MRLPPEVSETLDPLLAGAQAALGENLVGVYLRGSLALGDFVPSTSDVDVLAATERPVSAGEFSALVRLDRRIAAAPHPYARRLELAYIDRAALRRFEPGQQHPTLYQGERLEWSEHRPNWILERWTVRERGVTLLGPDPRTLIDPITSDELQVAVRTRLADWADWAEEPGFPEQVQPRSHIAYVVETMCRARYTLAHGELSSKRHAVEWALGALPAPWRELVARSRAWRTDTTVDSQVVPEVMRFVLWAAR